MAIVLLGCSSVVASFAAVAFSWGWSGRVLGITALLVTGFFTWALLHESGAGQRDEYSGWWVAIGSGVAVMVLGVLLVASALRSSISEKH
jgi:hypothetical protein